MNNLIKKSLKAFREGGITMFLERTYNYLRIREGVSNFYGKFFKFFKPRIIKKIKNFNSSDPEKVFDFAWKEFFLLLRPLQIKEEFVELLKIFQKNKPKYILEIGTAYGGSLFCFCKLAPEDATIISIDLPGGPFGEGYPEWKIPIYQAFKKAGQKLYLLREDSHSEKTFQKVKEILNRKKLDFLFIDGDHSYEGVKKDFEMYSKLVEGVIVLHDIVYNSFPGCQVERFWQEIKGKFKTKEIIKNRNQEGYGIGIIFKNESSKSFSNHSNL